MYYNFVAARKRARTAKISSKAQEASSSPSSKWSSLLTGLLAIVLALLFLYSYKTLFVVARVNNKLISRGELTRELEREAGNEALESLVTKNLILQEARKKGITVDKEEVDAEIKKIEDGLVAQGQTLEDALTFQGWSREQLEEQIKIRKMIEKIFGDEVEVTEEEIDNYLKENEIESPDREQIKAVIKDQKFSEKFQEWITTLRANAKINFFVDF